MFRKQQHGLARGTGWFLRVISASIILLYLSNLPIICAETLPKPVVLPPSPQEILDRALKRANWIREQKFESRLVGEYVGVREELNKEKGVKSREEILCRVYPVAGHLYYERVVVDGKPLVEEELQQRKEYFRKEIANSTSKRKETDDSHIEFNKELVSRYDIEIVGMGSINGRPAFVLHFKPKRGKLPVRRRIDYVLNNSRGKLWIDNEDFGIVRVQFELTRSVKLWAGILGKIGVVTGNLEQTRLADGVWLPMDISIYMKGRVLFKSFHQQRQLQWRNLKLTPK